MKKFLDWKNLSAEDKKQGVFILTLAFAFLFMMYSGLHTGVNADDRYHVPSIPYFSKFYTSFGQDTIYRQAANDLHLGPEWLSARVMVDMVNLVISKPFGYIIQEEGFHTLRHIIISLIGFLALVYVSLITYRVRQDWIWASVASLLLLFSPRFLGHATINPRDIPFLAFGLMAAYYSIRYIETYPKHSWKYALLTMLGIGLSLNVRNGGFLFVVYFAFFIGLNWIAQNWFFKKKMPFPTKSILHAAVVYLGAYAIGMIFWPKGLDGQAEMGLFQDISQSQQYPLNIRQLFEGKMMMSNEFPWYYQLKFISITTPISVLAGLALFVLFGLKKTIKSNWLPTAIVAFAALFPPLYIIYSKANVYTGWRHILFCYPYFVILATLGWAYVAEKIKNAKALYIALGLTLLTSLPAIWYVLNNRDHVYCYFNELVGGNKGAWGEYEQDYWALSVSEGGKWLAENVLSKNNGDTIVISSNMQYSLEPYLYNDIQNGKAKYLATKYYRKIEWDWDYGIYYAAFLGKEFLTNPNSWPPKNAVHVIEAGGAPIGVIVKRDPEKNDYLGMQALKAQNIPLAKQYFEKSLAYDPYDYEVNIQMGKVLLFSNDVQNGINYLNNALKLDPDHAMEAYYWLGKAYAAVGDMQNAQYYANIAAQYGMK